MPEISIAELMTAVRRIAHSPLEAERMVRFIIIEMMLLAVMLGLFTVSSDVPEVSNNGPGISAYRPQVVPVLQPATGAGLLAAPTGTG